MEKKKNQTTKEQATDNTNIPATTDQATDNTNIPATTDQDVKALDVAKDVAKLTKQTGKKIWSKIKKPLAITGGIILATGALLVGSEMIAQSKAKEEPDNPEEDDGMTVYDLDPETEVDITDETDETEETPEETTE